jgi:aspartyl-tRNA(Asn)/glutamyl-tRNA(Gln) amidotransferase subunit A
MDRLTVSQLSAGLRSGEFSSEELTRQSLARIEAANPSLNAFITVMAEEALTAARAADRRLASGKAGPLTGIPLAHKDIFCTAGTLTSCGSRMLANFVSPYDATVVSKLADAGIVVVGKTNMDEFAMGSSNETSYFGPVRNPWDMERSPGGSSGGSAAAVAAGLVPAATGTDTGGSIRQPAAFTGITGFKPTYGRVSRYGMVAFASSLDQAGTLTATAEDAALLMEAMAGFDARDSTSADQAVPAYSSMLDEAGFRLRAGNSRCTGRVCRFGCKNHRADASAPGVVRADLLYRGTRGMFIESFPLRRHSFRLPTPGCERYRRALHAQPAGRLWR